MPDKSENYGYPQHQEDNSDLDVKQVNHNDPAPGDPARFPPGFISKYTERGTQEATEHATEWDREDAVSDKFSLELKKNHPDLFDEFQKAARGELYHWKSSWTRQHPTHEYTPDKASKHTEIRMNPNGSAGRIFNTYNEATQGSDNNDYQVAAFKIIETLTSPVDNALQPYKDEKLHQDWSIPDFTQLLQERMHNLQESAWSSLALREEDQFCKALNELRNLGTDTYMLETEPGFRPSFAKTINDVDPRLALDFQNVRNPESENTGASWLERDQTYKNGANLREIFDRFTDQGFSDDGYAEQLYIECIEHQVVKDISHPVTAQLEEFLDSREKTPAMEAVAEYFNQRLAGIEEMTLRSLTHRPSLEPRKVQAELEDLIHVQDEIKMAWQGELPQENWDDKSESNESTNQVLGPVDIHPKYALHFP